MSMAMALHEALKSAGISIVGVSVARLDAAGKLAKWQEAGTAVDFGHKPTIDDDGVVRVLDAKDAAEINQKIATFAAMVEDPTKRPWDKTRWTVDYGDDATDDQKAQAAHIIANFDPDSIVKPNPRSFAVALSRLTVGEFKALKAARAAHDEIDLLYDRAMAQSAGLLDLNDPEVTAGFAALVALKVFTQERLGELFA